MAGAAALITLDSTGVCEQADLVFLSVGDTPSVAKKSCGLLKGQKLTPELFKAAAETAAREEIDPSSDIHASAEFRRHLARVLAFQSLSEAYDRAKAIGG